MRKCRLQRILIAGYASNQRTYEFLSHSLHSLHSGTWKTNFGGNRAMNPPSYFPDFGPSESRKLGGGLLSKGYQLAIKITVVGPNIEAGVAKIGQAILVAKGWLKRPRGSPTRGLGEEYWVQLNKLNSMRLLRGQEPWDFQKILTASVAGVALSMASLKR
jgi:hypothetical protein